MTLRTGNNRLYQRGGVQTAHASVTDFLELRSRIQAPILGNFLVYVYICLALFINTFPSASSIHRCFVPNIDDPDIPRLCRRLDLESVSRHVDLLPVFRVDFQKRFAK